MLKFSDLREFIKYLEHKQELKKISHAINSNLEITEISRRILEKEGPAILFEKVIKQDGNFSSYPMLTNLFASKKRIAWGLGLDNYQELRNLGYLLASVRQPEMPSSFKESLSMLPLISRILSMRPKIIKKASCHEIIIKDNIDLNILPIQKCWPQDAAPLITWPLVVTKTNKAKNNSDKNTAEQYNLGIYRMQYIAPSKLLVRWLKVRGGSMHYQKWVKENKEPFPIAAVIGANPALTLSAVMPLPSNISEYNFAGFLAKKNMELVNCATIDLKVPADAEIVIEGYINPQELMQEGPFGDHTGYYNEIEYFPVVNVTAITMRSSAIYLSTYTGKPPDEPSILAEALNEIFIPLLQQYCPEIIDFYLPPEGCSYRVAVAAIKKSYAGQAKRAMMAIWSCLSQFMYTKLIIIVDEDINIRDWKEVIWAVSTKCDFARDSVILENTPIDYLDFASIHSGLGGKMGLDATNKLPPETNRTWGQEIKMNKEVQDKINSIWHLLGF